MSGLTEARPSYKGRFAPSPTGPLHMGSLFCALGSYLDARAHRGVWLLRIEDIDPPREQRGAATAIRQCLLNHGLQWDEEPHYQSRRSAFYDAALSQLLKAGYGYLCNCSRKRLQTLNGCYDGHCRDRPPSQHVDCAVRFKSETVLASYVELLQTQLADADALSGDFVIRRRDGLYGYQLAVSVDDACQQMTRVVRGCDLLETTAQQVQIMRALGHEPPEYLHLPVITAGDGRKLSKQNKAEPVNIDTPVANLRAACKGFGFNPPDHLNTAPQLLNWATERWALQDLKHLNKCAQIPLVALV